MAEPSKKQTNLTAKVAVLGTRIALRRKQRGANVTKLEELAQQVDDLLTTLEDPRSEGELKKDEALYKKLLSQAKDLGVAM